MNKWYGVAVWYQSDLFPMIHRQAWNNKEAAELFVLDLMKQKGVVMATTFEIVEPVR